MDLLKFPKDVVFPIVMGKLSQRLEKLQDRLRIVGRFIPVQSQQALLPALPYGEGLERFHQPGEALKSWADKQTQWWYFTGHLATKEGRRFSFQYVAFERHASQDFFGVLPTRIWTEEFHVAHFAVSNIDALPGERRFRYYQKGGLLPHFGFSSEERFHVDLDGWQMHQEDESSFRLLASEDGTTLQLKVEADKPLCYHGANGYAAKNARVEDGSLYCSFTRLKASGKLLIDGVLHEVTGSAWMDHEKMAADDRVFHNGWDWYSLQLDNGCELMLYLLKDANGDMSSYAMGSYFDKDGKTHAIQADDIQWDRLQYWKSPRSKANYPVVNHIRITSLGLDLRVNPLLEDQEMDTSKTAFITYWEGAVSAEGTCRSERVTGRGYLELVGYDRRPRSQILKFLTRPTL
ncbi:MAG: lipocalin family protein [Bdellovibrionota bacterium]